MNPLNASLRLGQLPATASLLQEVEKTPSIPHQLWTKATAWLTPAAPPKSIEIVPPEISQRSGELWECLSREKGPVEGFIYKFKLRDEYDDVTLREGQLPHELKGKRDNAESRMKKIFPAIEMLGCKMLALDPNISESELSPAMLNTREHLPVLLQLGYRSERTAEGMYLYLPDGESLIANWEKLREERLELPPLNIQSTEGIASDLDFVKAYFTYDGILSSGKEFLHDHQAHILSVILLILSSEAPSEELGVNPPYREEKSRIVRLLGKTYRRIMIGRDLCKSNFLNLPEAELALLKLHLPKIEATLGSLADILSSKERYTSTQRWNTKTLYTGDEFFQAWTADPDWGNYFYRRFGACKRQEVIALGKRLEEYERRFDALPKNSF